MGSDARNTWQPRTTPPRGSATVPGPGQESVWDYPRPPSVVPSTEHVVVRLGEVVADTRRAIRVLETSHPPTYYLPRADVAEGLLVPSGGATTFCEFKGRAIYFDVAAGGRAASSGPSGAAPEPSAGEPPG